MKILKSHGIKTFAQAMATLSYDKQRNKNTETESTRKAYLSGFFQAWRIQDKIKKEGKGRFKKAINVWRTEKSGKNGFKKIR